MQKPYVISTKKSPLILFQAGLGFDISWKYAEWEREQKVITKLIGPFSGTTQLKNVPENSTLPDPRFRP